MGTPTTIHGSGGPGGARILHNQIQTSFCSVHFSRYSFTSISSKSKYVFSVCWSNLSLRLRTSSPLSLTLYEPHWHKICVRGILWYPQTSGWTTSTPFVPRTVSLSMGYTSPNLSIETITQEVAISLASTYGNLWRRLGWQSDPPKHLSSLIIHGWKR